MTCETRRLTVVVCAALLACGSCSVSAGEGPRATSTSMSHSVDVVAVTDTRRAVAVVYSVGGTATSLQEVTWSAGPQKPRAQRDQPIPWRTVVVLTEPLPPVLTLTARTAGSGMVECSIAGPGIHVHRTARAGVDSVTCQIAT